MIIARSRRAIWKFDAPYSESPRRRVDEIVPLACENDAESPVGPGWVGTRCAGRAAGPLKLVDRQHRGRDR
jgi:hypothetical protein